MSTTYNRVLIKISGEQLQGQRQHGIDPEFLGWLSQEIAKLRAHDIDVVIVVGGGNLMRGAAFAKHGMDRVMSDYIGMMATIMNGMALTDMLEQHGMTARLMTRLQAESVAEPYIYRRALRHLEKGRIVIIGGGTGNPYVTTDTAAVQGAVELHCDVVLKATNVDGVYDKDPQTNDNATLYETLTLAEAVSSPTIRVMDKTALAMAADNELPIVVFNLNVDGNIERVATGEKIGTKVL